MPPPTLDEHVFAEILLHCDIYDVLKFTQVNKWCRSAALSKQLWISLIRDLEFRGMRDVDPSERLEDCTTDDLIAKVKRVASGPRTWLPSSPTPPTLEREVLVQLGPPHYEPGTFVQLLPGGKHFVLRRLTHGSVYEIWAISTQQCIWSRPPRPMELSAIDIVDGGEKAVVAFGSPTQPPFVELIEVDLHTGESSLLFRKAITREIEITTTTRLQLSGEHLAFPVRTKSGSEVHVVNWARATYVCLRFPMTDNIAYSLVRGHIFVVHLNGHPDRRLCASLYSLHSLDWHSIRSWHLLLSETSSPVSSLMLPFAEGHLIQTLELVAVRSPVRRDAYKFTLHLPLIPKPPSAGGLMSRLWVRLRPGNQSQPEHIHYSFVFVPPMELEMVVSTECLSLMHRPMYVVGVLRLGGRVIIYDGANECREVKFPINHLLFDGHGPLPKLGTYSAALPLVKDNVLRIMYFQ
ncbi:hypothetical protein FB45DRAFT_1063554 [Roridomyces roridus]|uniref:F-box domain-containing protein n=1 Tax=Roridomyces roridus TaxID=1738132 RepID=A0AAD7BEF2_9AGAR|nr:hypothetical protein FB45DRAFT_1063554 [Roridomyces roridus]